MADKVKLLELDIDMDALLTNVAKLKMSIDDLKAKQKTLDTSTLEGAKAFASNAAEIKNLSEQYRIGEGAVRNLTASTNDQVNITRLVNGEMSKEVNTIKEAQTQNAYLNKIKKDLNVNNKEQKALIDQINQKLDSNTSFIKENSSEQEKQFMNVGNYKSAVSDLIGQLKNGEIGLGGFANGFAQMGKAFIANPIELNIIVIVHAITALYNIFKSFQPVVDKIEQIFAGLSAVLKVLKDGFKALITGSGNAGKSLNGLAGDMKHAYEEAVRLKKAIQDLEDSMEAQSIATAQNRAEIKRLETEAKNTALSYVERNNLLHQAEVIRQKDFGQRMADALEEKNIAIDLLKTKAGVTQEEIYLLEQGGDAFKENYIKTKDLSEKKATAVQEYFDKYGKAQINIASMQEEFSAEQERNYNKQAANEEKAQAEREKAYQDSKQRTEKQKEDNIKNATSELNLFIATEESKKKSLAESLEYQTKLKDERLKLLEVEFVNGAKTQKEYDAEKLNIEREYNDTFLQLTSERLNKELEIWKLQNADLLASKGELSQATIEIEKATQKTLYDKRKEIIDATIQDEQDKQIALLQLENDYRNALTSIDDEWKSIQATKKQAERDQAASDYEIKLQELQLQTENELVIEQTIYDRKKLLLIQALEDKKITQAQYDAQALVDKQNHENKIVEIERQSRMQSMEVSQNAFKTFGELASAFGVKSKGLNIALTTIDTYFAAQKAYMSQFLPVPDPSSPIRGAIAAAGAVASGIARVKQIASTKFASGGLVSGAGTGTSDSIDAKLSNGESVMTAKATAMFRPFLSAMNVAGGGVPFASGGVVGSNALSSVMPTFKVENQTLSADQINDLVDRKINAVKVINVTDETAAVMNAKNKVQNFANV